MTSNNLFIKFLPVAAMVTAGTLVGCSTVKSISPFGSNVPYAQDVQPNMAKPAVSEIPAFKPKPAPPPAPKPEPKPEPAEASPPAQAPAAAPPAPASAPAAAPSPPASQSSVTPTQAAPKAAEAPLPAPRSEAAAQSSAPVVSEKAAEPGKAAAPDKVAADMSGSDDTAEAGKRPEPEIPAERRVFKDDGTYPNLAQVPARPVNLPTFAEAKVLEKALVTDRDKAKDEAPASPSAPAVDSAPVPVKQILADATAAAAKLPPIAQRAEDDAPCLTARALDGQSTATIHFDLGSAAMTSANLAHLVEALPTLREAKGTIRIFGHGDTETNAPVGSGRFDLAAARAGAVAQAVAGYGIPVSRLAVGVACSDAASAGASVQLYAES